MDPSKVRESQKTKHFLSLLRIMAGSVWIILWLFLFSVYDPDSGNGLFAALLYPGIILFLFAADWTGRKVYGIQVRIAFQEICSTVQSFDPASDYGVLLRNDVVSGLCQKSLLLDRCGNDPIRTPGRSFTNPQHSVFTALFFPNRPSIFRIKVSGFCSCFSVSAATACRMAISPLITGAETAVTLPDWSTNST